MPRLGADVPRWYGETIGFWDGDVLITWTSNVQGWTSHGQFEFSSKMQTVEIYTPNRDANGQFVGFNHEAMFYDPEALVEPIRIVRDFSEERFRRRRAVRVPRVRARRSSPSTAATPVAPGTGSSSRCPTCTAARGRRSGRSTGKKA